MMLRRAVKHHAPIVAGAAMLALFLGCAQLMPQDWREVIRENAFDLVLAADQTLRPATNGASNTRIIVVDIDRKSIEAVGPWPWSRDRLAGLLEAVTAAKPSVIAVDILLAEPDAHSPAALARRLGALANRADLVALADDLPDGNKNLINVLGRVPVALGFVLDPDKARAVPGAPIVTRGSLPLDALWRAAGAEGPQPPLAEAAAGLGALSLPGDVDGIVRRVPLLVGAADAILPGLALETVRLSRNASTYLIQSETRMLAAGDLSIPLPRDALLRLLPIAAGGHAARTISAIDVIDATGNTTELAGAVALIGGSAPELGALRKTPSDTLTPSVQIQADAVAQIVRGRVPRPFRAASMIEPVSICAVGVLAIAAGAVLSPAFGATAIAAAVALVWAVSLGLSLFADRLVDPLMPSLAGAIGFIATSMTSYAVTRRREALVRRRFEQHLAPAVVSRIVAEPHLVKLAGERREVTSLFTDIEGFTAMTHRTAPEMLVAVLDDYFEGIAAIVIEHGGMVDKIVGDAVHALFNAPIDVADHPRAAVDCAVAVREWADAYRRRNAPTVIGLGRTRVGIETGQAIVGDVGIRAKLDYTAYGDAINASARFEAANKELGSTICVGPAAAARCDPTLFRPLGSIVVRGREERLAVFEPWPADAPPAWRQDYLAAARFIDEQPLRAIELFERLATERRDDPVPRRMAERLRSRE